MRVPPPRHRSRGLTLIEVLIALALGAMVLAALGTVVGESRLVLVEARSVNRLTDQAAFAMGRMVRAIEGTTRVMVPLAEDPDTASTESSHDPGELAMTLDPTIDRDLDGVPDADNDGDGRIDEDLPSDATNDARPGVRGVDDDNSGFADFSLAFNADDDETATFGGANEDPLNGIDDDGDGAVDEDPPADMNGDGAPGLAGIDDDGDGIVDEGSANDDDEDGQTDEDWWDAVVFRLIGTDLVERVPVPWDENGSGGVTGRDYVEKTIAAGVSGFVVTRNEAPAGGRPLIAIALTLTDAQGRVYRLDRTVRAGGGP